MPVTSLEPLTVAQNTKAAGIASIVSNMEPQESSRLPDSEQDEAERSSNSSKASKKHEKVSKNYWFLYVLEPFVMDFKGISHVFPSFLSLVMACSQPRAS